MPIYTGRRLIAVTIGNTFLRRDDRLMRISRSLISGQAFTDNVSSKIIFVSILKSEKPTVLGSRDFCLTDFAECVILIVLAG